MTTVAVKHKKYCEVLKAEATHIDSIVIRTIVPNAICVDFVPFSSEPKCLGIGIPRGENVLARVIIIARHEMRIKRHGVVKQQETERGCQCLFRAKRDRAL